MTNRLLDIDDAALLHAQRILETRTMKETVNKRCELLISRQPKLAMRPQLGRATLTFQLHQNLTVVQENAL